jgi:hypothetical protein
VGAAEVIDFAKNLSNFEVPDYILSRWRQEFSANEKQSQMAVSALKDWFSVLRLGYPRHFGMTSKSVDFIWHELILNTRLYAKFCEDCLGFFAHHTTNEADERELAKSKQKEEVLRTWMSVCLLNKIDPVTPKELPALFKMDRELRVVNGFYYQLPEENLGYFCPAQHFSVKSA